MRAVAEVNKYVSDTEPWKIKDDPARPAGHDPARDGAVRRRPQPGAGTVPAASPPTRSTRPSAGPGDVAPMPRLVEVEDLDGGAGVPRPHRRLHRCPPVGAGDRSPSVRPSPSRRRSSPSSTPRWSTRSWPGSSRDDTGGRGTVSRPHLAGLAEDGWNTLLGSVLRARGWRPLVIPHVGYGGPAFLRVLARVVLAPEPDPGGLAVRSGWPPSSPVAGGATSSPPRRWVPR